MDNVIAILFLILWIAVAFAVLRWIARWFFHEPLRAEVAALTVAVAFALGASWPYSARIGNGAPTSSVHVARPVVASMSAPPRPPAGRLESSSACPRAIAQGKRGTTQYGSIDQLSAASAADTNLPDGSEIDRSSYYVMQGWVADPSGEGPAKGACLIVDGKLDRRVKVYMGLLRPDVATGYHRVQLIPSGYEIIVPPDSLPVGSHRLQVAAITGAGNTQVVPVERHVIVH